VLQSERWKLKVSQINRGEPNYELFDLAEDPDETRDVAAAHPGVVDRLAAKLPSLPRADQSDDSGGEERPLDDTTREQLEALGYVE
jgi:hypothetical protein